MSEPLTERRPTYIKIGGETFYTKPHPDDLAIDRVEATMHPRWKESELSGDEWRWSHTATGYRKGQEIVVKHGHDLADALLLILPELRRGFGLALDECAQPQCEEAPTVLYRIIKEYSSDGRYVGETVPSRRVRPFCARHIHRGDCGREDNDDNYEAIRWWVNNEWVDLPPLESAE